MNQAGTADLSEEALAQPDSQIKNTIKISPRPN
jgi:hypothetical protein